MPFVLMVAFVVAFACWVDLKGTGMSREQYSRWELELGASWPVKANQQQKPNPKPTYDVWIQIAGNSKMPWSRVATGLTEAQAVAFQHHALFKVHIEKTPE